MKEFDFYIVPTPIGNINDISYRAVGILHNVDIIACEDSRTTQKLLNHYNIKTKCLPYHKFNERERTAKIIELIKEGNKIALVSDAGTPLICDPGAIIVKELRKNGFTTTALPGANAFTTFLSQISRDDERFVFYGFLPRVSSQIENVIKKYEYEDFVFYESPNRIVDTLKIINNLRPDANVAIGRELTKVFEEIKIDTPKNLINYFEQNSPKGEFTVMIFRSKEDCQIGAMEEKIKILQDKGYSAKDISIILSELYDYNKNMVYKYSIGKTM